MATIVQKLQPSELIVSDLTLENAWFKKSGQAWKYQLPDLSGDVNVLTQESTIGIDKLSDFNVALVEGNDGKFMKYDHATTKLILADESNTISDYSLGIVKLSKDSDKKGNFLFRNQTDGEVVCPDSIMNYDTSDRIVCSKPVWMKNNDIFYADNTNTSWYQSFAQTFFRTQTTTAAGSEMPILSLYCGKKMRLVIDYKLTGISGDQSEKFVYQSGQILIKSTDTTASKSSVQNQILFNDGFATNLEVVFTLQDPSENDGAYVTLNVQPDVDKQVKWNLKLDLISIQAQA